ncbi:MAG: hypothetical protein AB8G26_15880 [Ilumatobacter sp.]
MSSLAIRGNGVGLEVAGSMLRGVQLRSDVPGRLAVAAELPVVLDDDRAVLDALTVLRAELGGPGAPTRIATFPAGTMMQRIDVTGRSGPDLNGLRAALYRRMEIDSTVIVDDGPRRWLLVIRWDATSMRRLEDLAERAGFVDVAVEPSPLALARVVPMNATFARRLATGTEAYQMVLSNRLPVCALPASASGRSAPDLDVASVDVTRALFDDLLDDAQLAELIDRAGEQVEPPTELPVNLVGDDYPPFPDHDERSARRQVVALGAAVGASGLAGPMRPVDIVATGANYDHQFDRPWAVERVRPIVPNPTPVDDEPPKRRRRFRRS